LGKTVCCDVDVNCSRHSQQGGKQRRNQWSHTEFSTYYTPKPSAFDDPQYFRQSTEDPWLLIVHPSIHAVRAMLIISIN
jgi:hypothetical protein